jgi:hypothetical protein
VTGKLRKRIAGTCTALVLAITFGVMGTTGIALAGGDTTGTTRLAETRMVTAPSTSESGGGFGKSPTCRIPMVHIQA